jgi:hypothetical protein
MDEKYIKEEMLVERYLEGKLTAEQAASFEEQFLSSDELLNELEAAERLGQGLHDMSALENAHVTNKPTSNIVSSSNFTALFQSPRFAMAASFMLLVSLSVSSVLLQKNAHLSEFGSNQAIPTEIIPLVSVRGAAGNELNTLPLGDAPKQFVLMLDPGFETYSHYRATVYQLDSAKEPAMLWQVDEMLPGYEDMLALSVPSSVLNPGDYEIQLEGWLDEWPANHGFEQLDTKTFKIEK